MNHNNQTNPQNPIDNNTYESIFPQDKKRKKEKKKSKPISPPLPLRSLPLETRGRNGGVGRENEMRSHEEE